jgi:hypothetical protein
MNNEVKGTTSVTGSTMTDYCNKDGVVKECSGTECYLNEHFCAGTMIAQQSDIVCPYGCADGACKAPAVNTTWY